jgi:hypothetical protein
MAAPPAKAAHPPAETKPASVPLLSPYHRPPHRGGRFFRLLVVLVLLALLAAGLWFLLR